MAAKEVKATFFLEQLRRIEVDDNPLVLSEADVAKWQADEMRKLDVAYPDRSYDWLL